MYERDMPLMREHALASPEGLTDVIAFVLCTIRQPFQRVRIAMDDIRSNGENAAALFGSKRDGYRYALSHAPVLHAAIVAACNHRDATGAIDVLTNVPGLGIVKAAFVAQICGLEAACLDGHNLKRLGLEESAFKLAKSVRPATRKAKISAYLQACRDGAPKGCKRTMSKYWWDSWCEYVAGNKANKSLPTADIVSAYHWECIAP